MMICEQIRAARSLLRWSARELAEHAGLHISTVRRMESSNGAVSGNMSSVRRVEQTLETAGIEFLDGIDGPGVQARSWERLSG